MPQVAACRHADRVVVSDHSPVVLQLLPRGAGDLGPGLPRLRLGFLAHEPSRQQFAAWLAAQQPPPAPLEMVQSWWPAFMTRLHAQVLMLNGQARRAAGASPAGAARETAAAAVLAAHARVEACDAAALPGELAALVSARPQAAASIR